MTQDCNGTDRNVQAKKNPLELYAMRVYETFQECLKHYFGIGAIESLAANNAIT